MDRNLLMLFGAGFALWLYSKAGSKASASVTCPNGYLPTTAGGSSMCCPTGTEGQCHPPEFFQA